MWDGKYLDKAVETLILQKKASVWQNEQEYRMIAIPLAIANGIECKILSEEENGYKLQLPPGVLKEVYFGAKASQENINVLRNASGSGVTFKKCTCLVWGGN